MSSNDNSLLVRTGIVFQIMRFSIHDGPGIRTTVFLKGCPLRCSWCHNPESQSYATEYVFRPERCILCKHCENVPDGADQADVCPTEARERIGDTLTVGQVIDKVLRDRPFYDESDGGVTFSGGEPMAQPDFLEGLLWAANTHAIHTAVDTSGYTNPEILNRLAPLVNLFLYDIKHMNSAKHVGCTGVPNDRILGNLRLLVEAGKPIHLRLPLIPGINDDEENLVATARMAKDLGLRKISVLPYHGDVGHKYDRLGMVFPLAGTPDMPLATANRAAAILEEHGLEVSVGR